MFAAIFVVIGVLFNKALGLMETVKPRPELPDLQMLTVLRCKGKVFIGVNITMLLMSIRIVDNLTFDCRW